MDRVLLVLCMALMAHGEVADLTHNFLPKETIYWPTAQAFNFTMESRGLSQAGFWYETEDIAASTHGGTHMDAPAHFFQGKWHIDDIPVRRLVAPLVVINIKKKAAVNPISQVLPQDILNWETENGRIPPGAVVVMDSGWTQYWPNKLRYLGTDTKNTSLLRFPGFSPDAATMLTKWREIYGVGVDTPSVDFGPSPDFKSHQILGEHNVYILENVKLPDNIPASGATIMSWPMKIEGSSGAPCRVVAVWGQDKVNLVASPSGRVGVTIITLVSSLLALYVLQ